MVHDKQAGDQFNWLGSQSMTSFPYGFEDEFLQPSGRGFPMDVL
jgi:hypothetical protein